MSDLNKWLAEQKAERDKIHGRKPYPDPDLSENEDILLGQADALARLVDAMKIEHQCVVQMCKAATSNDKLFRNAASSAELASLDVDDLIAEITGEGNDKS